MVKIRLKRFGKRLRPFYRIVLMQARTKRQGESLEDLGSYDPIKKVITLESEKIKAWLDKGAQPSETVRDLLIRNKVITGSKYTKKFNSKPGKKATERAEKAKEAAEAKATAAEVEAAPEPEEAKAE